MARVLFYADPTALAAYLGGAALLEPALAEAACRAVTLRPAARDAEHSGGGPPARGGPDEEGTGAPRTALLFEDDALALPLDRTPGTSLHPAEVAPEGAELTVREDGQRARRYRVEGSLAAPRELAWLLPCVPWTRLPSVQEVMFLCRPGAPFARLVAEHLELGRDRLRYAPVRAAAAPPGASAEAPAGDGGEGPEEERILLEVPDPSWFLLERWIEDRPADVSAYRRLPGPTSARRVYVEWGFEHPLADWLADPPEDTLLLLDRRGTPATLEVGALRDVADALALDGARFPTARLEPGAEPARLEVRLRLEGRAAARDPELWLLPARERSRLEELLAQTPEEELRNLMVALFAPGSGEDEPLFAVREVLTGRAPRLLPLGARAFAAVPGLPNLLLPCASALAPPLGADRYAKAFDLRPGELTVVEEAAPDGRAPVGGGDALPAGALEAAGRTAAPLRLLKVSEGAFQPVATIVDFVFHGHVRELERTLLAAPFDLEELAELDLVPAPGVAPSPPPPPPAGRPARAPAPPRLEPDAGEPAAAETPPPALSLARSAPDAGDAARDPALEAIARLQRALVLDEATPARWLELGRLHLARGDLDEAIGPLETAAWDRADAAAASALEALEAGVAAAADPPGGREAEAIECTRRVFAYLETAARRGVSADAQRRATEGVYEAVRAQEGRLRKRSRWLLWTLVLRDTRDAIELERQREALLAELALRGIEEREVPAFVRQLLLEEHGQRRATGSGATEALEFLADARRFAAGLEHPVLQAEALAHVAWALAELGQGEPAVELARQAERQVIEGEGAPPLDSLRPQVLGRVGAVLERVRGHDRGRAGLEAAFERLERLLGEGGGEVSEGWKALVSCLAALADAWAGQDRREDPLLTRALGAFDLCSPNDQASAALNAGADLLRLGLSAPLLERARGLLRPEQLEQARAVIRASPHPQAYAHARKAYPGHILNLLEALELFKQGEAVAREDSDAIVAALRREQDLINEFSIAPFAAALRASATPAWQLTEEVTGELERRGAPYEAALLRIAGLQRLAELGERQRGGERLADALERAWELPVGDKDRPPHRVLTRLVALVPAFGLRRRGLELLADVHARARARGSEEASDRNEQLTAIALAAAKLGDAGRSFDLIAELAEQAIAELGAAGRHDRAPWLLFETLDACLESAAELGERRRGLELVARVAGVALDASRARDAAGWEVAGYFYCRTLICCGATAAALGDGEGAAGHFEQAFVRLRALNPFDQRDVLEKTIATAGQLSGERRYELARRILAAAAALAGQGDYEKFGLEFTRRLAQEMVRGEGAFAAALKRWKGREEREIRDRVAHEEV